MKFVQSRCSFLDHFCKNITKLSYLSQSNLFQRFIRGAADFSKVFVNSNRHKKIHHNSNTAHCYCNTSVILDHWLMIIHKNKPYNVINLT